MMLVVEVYGLACAQVFLAWAGTYVIISTAAFALVWLLRFRLSHAWEERLWRGALFGAPVVAGIRACVSAFTDGGGSAAPFLASQLTVSAWPRILVLSGWTLLALIVCLLAARGLWRMLSLERAPAPAAYHELAARLALEIGAPQPHVTRSHALASPAALGTREICLPYRLEPAESLIAHEIAHLARRDPWWSFAARLTALLCCIQPLNFLVTRRLHLLAELACDRTAANLTSPRALVDALTALAGLHHPNTLQPHAGALQSGLMRRVRAIVAGAPEPHARPISLALRALALAAILAFTPAIEAAPHSTANTLAWLAPSREPPNSRMLELRAAEIAFAHAIDRMLPW